MILAKLKHRFGIHTPDKLTERAEPTDQYNQHANCIVCGIDMTGKAPWE